MNCGRILTGCLGWDKLLPRIRRKPPRASQPLLPASGGHGSTWRLLDLGGGEGVYPARSDHHHQGPRAHTHLSTTCHNTRCRATRSGPWLISRRMKTMAAASTTDTASAEFKRGVGQSNIQKLDLTIESLHKKYKRGLLNLSPHYQRGFVWNRSLCDMLVETVFMGLPIPEVWIHAKREGDKRVDTWDVVDGQQRLTTLLAFIDGNLPAKNGPPTEFRLRNLESEDELNGKVFGELEEPEQTLFMDYYLSVRVISSDTEPERVYETYRRINSGSMNLSDQQVRRAAFWGPYIQMLDELASYKTMKLIRREENVDPKEADRELILRFFAMHSSPNTYKVPMYKFLNRHLHANRKITEAEAARMANLFKRTIDTVFFVFGDTALRKEKNSKSIDTALWDTVLSVFAKYDKGDFAGHQDALREDLEALVSDPSFSELLKGSLSQKRLSERVFAYEERVKRIVGSSTLGARRTYPFDLKEKLFEDSPTCSICGNEILSITAAEVDHIIPVARGGAKDDPVNAQLVHQFCNRSKGAKMAAA